MFQDHAIKKSAMKVVHSRHGHHVEMAHSISQKANGHNVLTLHAHVDGHRQTKIIALGPHDSKKQERPEPPTTEELQGLIDRHKQEFANEVSWHKKVGEHLDKLK